jgi:hypothetical protein
MLKKKKKRKEDEEEKGRGGGEREGRQLGGKSWELFFSSFPLLCFLFSSLLVRIKFW